MRRTRSRRRTGLLCQEECDTREEAQMCKLVPPRPAQVEKAEGCMQ